ncbi:MAG TPA: membrane protein insertase YidC [Candidatus Acidoferrales bacterium]|nr:membrane protein insertase YidC [Candidatus Acidoferrales bacterium]
MSDPQNKEMSPQWRMLLASVLAIIAIVIWSKYFGPKLPPPGQNPPGVIAPQTPQGGAAGPAASVNEEKPPEQPARGGAKAASKPAPQAIQPRVATQEKTIVVENELYRVEFSNRGAVVKSWKLKKYEDDNKPPRTLDLVHPGAAEQLNGWPFSLALDDATQEAAANSALYVASTPAETVQAPADLRYEWSDGHLEVTKEFHFDHSYVVHVDTTVRVDGKAVAAGIAWRGGFGDTTVINPAPFDRVMIFKSAGGKLDLTAHKSLGAPNTLPSGLWPGPYDYAGIQDTYFAAVFIPEPEGAASRGVTQRAWVLQYKYLQNGQAIQEPVAEMAAGPSAAPGTLELRVYVGPKDYDELKRMTPPLNALVQFGWFEFISAPLFYLLKWEHKYIANYGWAIIALTFAINMVMYPLKVISWRTMQKMQKVAPEIRQINDRYKKYSFRETEKQQQKQQEIMAVYNREGINPFGGASCILSLVQLPIWFGLNRMLGATIELRHQPWFWIRDLSARDPIFILPVLAAISMYLTQKMTPVAATDPSQQQMMKFMPIIFSGMFIIYPWSSGLMLYIVTSTIVAIGQQWYLNKTHPAPASAKPVRGKKK